MGKWLYNILKDNTIVDNQEYVASNGVFHNYRLDDGGISLLKKGRQHYKPHKDNNGVWKFLYKASHSIDSQSSQLILFDSEEYEHNTDDAFISVNGLDYQNFRMKTGNLIGYVKEGNNVLKISSRFGDDFLKYIIADADGFLSIKNQGGISSENDYEWLMYFLWSIKLKKAYRLGLPKEYKTFTEELKKVKGQIDPLHYYQHHQEGTYRCNYREHSYDTLQASLILEAFNQIPKNHSFIQDLHSVKSAFATATRGKRLKPTELYHTKHFSNPFYSDYNPVIDLSKQILRGEFSGFGEDKKSDAFLFDVSMLFEYFVKKLLIRNGISVRSKFQEALKIHTGIKPRRLEPDLLIETEKGIAVFDVKYKNFDHNNGVKREDLFQLHTYIGQYGNAEIVSSCGFIYPQFGDENKIIEQTIVSMGREVPFYVCLLAVPKEKKDFNELFSSQCNSFIEKIKKIIN